MKWHSSGFTLIELIIAVCVFTLLFGLVSGNLLNYYHKNTFNTQVITVISDINKQQLKAMVGDTEGRVAPDSYGIHFGVDRYILFHGSSYNAADSTNFTILLDTNMNLTDIAIPSSSLIFAKGSGEFTGFTGSNNTFIMKDIKTNEQKTITINRYGIITSIN